MQRKLLLIIAIYILLAVGTVIIVKNFNKPQNAEVKSVSVSPISSLEPSPTPTFVPTQSPTASPSATLKPSVKLSKGEYKIAAFGDSMVDTMGENLDYLRKELSAMYPKTRFKMYNFGIGSQNVEMGLARFSNPFLNRKRNFPPIKEVNPDVLIIGSYSYNPFVPHDLQKHRQLLSQLLNQAKTASPNVYLLVEIAPLGSGFGEGPGGVNWPEDEATAHANNIIEQLNDSLTLAKTKNVTLIDVYTKSKVGEGKYGEPDYVDKHDGIHPSILGQQFTARIIASVIKLK